MTKTPYHQEGAQSKNAQAKALSTNDYIELNHQFCAPTHAPIPVVLSKGQGARVWDIEGNEYIDFLSAFSVNDVYPLLCKRVSELLGYDRVASMSSGSEAVDLAIKIARKWAYNVKKVEHDQAKILTATGNYHGKILAPLSCSSNKDIKAGFGPFLPLVGPDVAGFPVRFNSLEDIQPVFKKSGKELAAIIIECVQGYGGCVPAAPGYLQAIQDLCHKHNVLFIADEIQTGFGRTGTLMAYQHENLKPDVVIVGKALTGGLYPMSLVIGNRSIMTQVQPGEHSSTFAANPLASAVALAGIEVTLG